MPDAELETVNNDAHDGLPAVPDGEPRTASEKLTLTLKELSRPDENAGELELTLATVAMGLERRLGPALEEHQRTGAVDQFVLDLVRFLALHRSDDAKQLLVVELPRAHEHGRPLADQVQDLPHGTRLRLLDEAVAAAAGADSPL
jgi:hypothetical protein